MLDLNSFEQGNFDLNIDSNKDLNPNPNSKNFYLYKWRYCLFF